MRKNAARMGMLSALLGMMGLGSMNAQAPRDGRDVQGQDEGRPNVVYFYGHSPIYVPSKSQRVKSKRMRASNKRQGRV